MQPDPASLAAKFAATTEHWRPKVIAELNGQTVRAVKTLGTFPWHRHIDAEEMFLVHKGIFRVEFREADGSVRVVTLAPGEFLVVPRGAEHRTASDEEAEVLIFEPADVVNTGDAPVSDFTAPLGDKV